MSENQFGRSWRVKLYELMAGGIWKDKGTGNVKVDYSEDIGFGLIVDNEMDANDILLQTKIKYEDIYERQNDNIIVWREVNESKNAYADLALSFQESSGCQSIWQSIVTAQALAVEPRLMGQVVVIDSDSDNSSAANNLSKLPPCSFENLDDIREKLVSSSFMSKKDALAMKLTENEFNYIKQLLHLTAEVDSAENISALHKIAEIWRFILLLNDSAIVEFIISDEIFIQVAGAMEYDPMLKVRANYREFLSNTVKLIQIGRAQSPSLQEWAAKLYRLKMLKDHLLRPAVDEVGITVILSMITLTAGKICSQLFHDTEYMLEVLRLINNPADCINSQDSMGSKRQRFDAGILHAVDDIPAPTGNVIISHDTYDAIRFLRELFVLTRTLSIDTRNNLFTILHEKSFRNQFFNAISFVLRSSKASWVTDDSSNPRLMMSEILAIVTTTNPSILREEVFGGPPILSVENLAAHSSQESTDCEDSTALVKRDWLMSDLHSSDALDNKNDPNIGSILYVIIRCLVTETNTAIIEHLEDTLKTILDTEKQLENRIEMEKFLNLFYDHYIHWLTVPFHEKFRHLKLPMIQTPSRCVTSSLSASAGQAIIELLCLCVRNHAYKMKYFIMRNNLLSTCVSILDRKERHLYLSVMKLLRTVITTKEDFYLRHIVKGDLLKEIFHLLEKNASKDNLITSTIVELVEFIRTENIRILVTYIMDKYSHCFENLTHVDVYDRIVLRHEQNQSYDNENGMNETSESVDYRGSKNKQFVELEKEEAYWDDDDDDDDTSDHSSVIKRIPSSKSQNQSQPVRTNPLSLLSECYGDFDDDDDERRPPLEVKSNGSASSLENMEIKSTDSTDNGTMNAVMLSMDSDDSMKDSMSVDDGDDPPLPPLRSKYEVDDTPVSAFFKGKNIDTKQINGSSSASRSPSMENRNPSSSENSSRASTAQNNSKQEKFRFAIAVKRPTKNDSVR